MIALSDGQLQQVLAAYGLPARTPVRILSQGNNLVYTIGQDPEQVLRVHRPHFREARHTRSELLFMEYLSKQLPDIDIPEPIPTLAGDFVLGLDDDGDRHCDLQTWVDGTSLSADDGLDEEAAHLLGRTLAQLHDAAAAYQPSPDFALPRWDGDGMFHADASPFRPLLRRDEILSEADLRDFADIEHRTREVFAELDQHPNVYGIIHFDYILGNVHLTRLNNAWHTGVIDFDDCGYGYFLYDLGPVLGNLIHYPFLQSALIRGYSQIRQLPPGWHQHLRIMMAARHTTMCYWTAGLGVSPTPREDARWRMQLARAALTTN